MPPPRDILREEIDRQDRILRGEMPERLALASLALALCAVFADPMAILALWGLYLVIEAIGPRVQAADRMLRSRAGYWAAMAQAMAFEAVLMLAVALVWHVESPFSKAFAVGMATMTLMHLATIRSIHLANGIAGLAGAGTVAMAANAHYWLVRDDLTGLLVSTTAAFTALAYGLTAMLSNHRMHRSMARSEAAARAAHDAKSLFLAQMSHELRTPLNAVIGMGQTALAGAARSDPGGPMQERLRILVESARSLAVILDDVTDLDAIAGQRLPLRPRDVALQDEIAAFFAAFRQRADYLGRPFAFHFLSPCPERVRIDTGRLRQCLGNVLSNVVRHAPDGPIRATCEAAPDGDGGGGVLAFEIRDSGPGVPEDQREAIFEAFHKGRDAAPGSGLGLAIARDLARQMGGDLRLVTPEPGECGAIFRLTLRYFLPQTGSPEADAPHDLKGRTVLVVDDIASNRLVAATFLRALGARVIEAAGGEAALSILAAEDVDLMLLDMNMPGIDGFETTRRARMMGGRTAALPIVATTADVMEAQVRAYREAGLDGHLPKPLLPELVAAEMRRLL